MTRNRIIAIVVGILLAVALSVGVFLLWTPKTHIAVPEPGPVTTSATPAPSPTETTTEPTVVTSPSAPATTVVPTTEAPEPTTTSEETTEAPTTTAPPEVRKPQVAANCVTTATGPFTPTNFRAFRLGYSIPIMTVGLEGDAAGSPPKNQPYKVAWFNGSPHPGSGKGNVVLTTHTYSKGQALGNDLYGANILTKTSGGTKVGDVWAVSDGKNTLCYEITDVHKVAVKDYDPNSDLIYDYAGPEELVMVICWDKNWSNGEWDSRVVFTGKRV